jgi:hypothetical protein
MWKIGALFLVWIVMRGNYAAYADLVRAKTTPEQDDAGDKPNANDNGGADAPSDPKSDDKIAPQGQSVIDWLLGRTPATPERP